MSFYEVPLIGRLIGRAAGSPGRNWRKQYDKNSSEDARKIAHQRRAEKGAALLLDLHYPGHPWSIECHGGVLAIRLPAIFGPFSYNIAIASMTDHDIIRGAGELLERTKIPRSGLKKGLAQFLAARQNRVSRHNQTPPGGLHGRR